MSRLIFYCSHNLYLFLHRTHFSRGNVLESSRSKFFCFFPNTKKETKRKEKKSISCINLRGFFFLLLGSTKFSFRGRTTGKSISCGMFWKTLQGRLICFVNTKVVWLSVLLQELGLIDCNKCPCVTHNRTAHKRHDWSSKKNI